MVKIAIIGGGASDVSVLDAMIRHCGFQRGQLAVTLIEPNREIGPGRAYGADGDYALLNRQARFMSIRPGDPLHFVDWARTVNGGEPAEFVPRSLFGAYLAAQFDKQAEMARDLGSPVVTVPASASAIYFCGGKILVRTARGESLKFDAAILCIGTAEPEDVFQLSGASGFIPSACPVGPVCAGIGPDEHVAILGAGLTAMDIVLGLGAQKHAGRITLLSRRGLLPAVRQPHRDFTLRRLCKETLAACLDEDGHANAARLLELLKAEFEAQGVAFSPVEAELAPCRDCVDRLRRHLAQTRRHEYGQSLLIEIVQNFVEPVWQKLRDADRNIFLDRYHPVFMSLCNPMPPATAATLEGLIARGQVSIERGVKSVDPDRAGGFAIVTGNRRFHADWVVNASRPEKAGIGRIGKPLVDSLVAAGDAWINPFGGVRIDPASLKILRRDGKAHPNLFAIGQLACGDLLLHQRA